jgi:lipopolysaccharide/colanic/teichoic acid biosynthesis glycosyltransferase/glycosyltransferase involved in cell wall biosynthesis
LSTASRVRTSTGKIKIVRVIARLNIGGPAIHVTNLSAGLDPSRFESLLVTGTENPGEGSLLNAALARGIRPVVIREIVGEASLKPRDLTALIALYRLMRAERPQIVHTHTAKAGFLGRLAARLAGVPLVLHTYHGHVLHGYYGPLKTRLLRGLERALAPMTDRIIAVSEQVKADLVGYGIARPAKISVIRLGFDLEPFLNSETHRGTLRGELGLDNGARLVGIVGRIFPIKNHRLFLEAAALVAGKEASARFVVVGDGILRPEMEEHARRLGIGDRVVFTGWRHDLPRIYPDLDVLVVSSKNEGTPVSAIEAMASGCPVVATRVGGLPDLIDEGTTGSLVPPEDAPALADAILRMLRNRDAARRMGQAARAQVSEQFRVERLICDLEGLYTELLAEKGILVPGAVAPRSHALKRGFDLLLSSVGLLLSAPLWAVVAAAVKLQDGGPVFFPQERWGQHQRRFRVHKFRTMIPNAGSSSVSVQAAEDDPRITPVGRVLRATALDELPQLLNIWKGEMSFVGPRALPINERQGREASDDLPDEKIPGFYERLRVQPGLTGIAQIYAPRDVLRRHKFRYDRLYIRRQSFWLDLKLIFLSFWITFRGAWERRGGKF